MSEPAKDQDQSMEEILQSIKRIIAEEGEPTPQGSDVLELTEMVADDGAVTKSKEPPEEVAALTIDEIMAKNKGEIADDMMPKAAPVAPAPTPEPVASPAPAPKPEPQPVMQAAPAIEEESLVSDATAAAAAAALDKLKSIPEDVKPLLRGNSMGFRSGTTVEDLVLESIKPMLHDWLESNLTEMVERLVERELRKITAR